MMPEDSRVCNVTCDIAYLRSVFAPLPHLHRELARCSAELQIPAAEITSARRRSGPRRCPRQRSAGSAGGDRPVPDPAAVEVVEPYRLPHGQPLGDLLAALVDARLDRKSTRLNSSHVAISYA